ncbi:F-box domain, Leucine-rich repeat domain, L domain-like protein [Artemisia annua]|uniref:F-box domain, Leucine-rich repeat domain, L domain-like protein n=1 Tax=Artemisia annua TaxID=35608 RepID=A0A2U1PL11_ARTAN|nr:F-box domain, Leucine-rich repeat domain, L domain-like protein [Artemisia annua]
MENLQEIWVKKESELAQNQMARLRVRLEHEKTKIETGITQVENLLQIGGRMTDINRCWEGLSKQIEQGRAKTDDIVSELKNIRYDLTKLPISKRAEMQACFSSLCSEANNVVTKIMDLVKILCDVKGSRFHVYFDELSTILEPSS